MANDKGSEDVPFWRRKSLEEMTDSEWESLCDGCARCCLNKLEEEGTDRTFYTNVGCRLLDSQACRCRDYSHRLKQVDDCVRLTPESANRSISSVVRRYSESSPGDHPSSARKLRNASGRKPSSA